MQEGCTVVARNQVSTQTLQSYSARENPDKPSYRQVARPSRGEFRCGVRVARFIIRRARMNLAQVQVSTIAYQGRQRKALTSSDHHRSALRFWGCLNALTCHELSSARCWHILLYVGSTNLRERIPSVLQPTAAVQTSCKTSTSKEISCNIFAFMAKSSRRESLPVMRV